MKSNLLLSDSWDNGAFLNCSVERLKQMIDTEEFQQPICMVLLQRMKNEHISEWPRGSFRYRLVNFMDKVTSFRTPPVYDEFLLIC